MLNSKKNILFIMTGSIACYKACSVISGLHQKGFQVQVVMSPSSLQFVGAATIEGLTGNEPITDMYASGSVMDHIHLARWADLILVAPATANYINKIAAGLGDDLLTTLFLAHDFKKPFLVAPAMNTMMYQHPTVQNSISQLRKFGVQILETASGVLACGEIGSGRLLDPQLIIEDVESHLKNRTVPSDLKKSTSFKLHKILITSGGTAEPIDDVRVLTNKSTGKTGAFLAEQFIDSGFEVHFLGSLGSARPNAQCRQTEFTTFADLESKLAKLVRTENFDWVLHAAAVSDYTVIPIAGKISSDPETQTLHLIKNKKLISDIKKLNEKTKLIGFKLTSNANQTTIDAKIKKLFTESHCDFVIQNDWADIEKGQAVYHLYNPNLDFKECSDIKSLSFHLHQTMLSEVL